MIKKKDFLSAAVHDVDFKDMRVLLRLDLNMPIINGNILNDYKFKAILPTIRLLLEKGAKIIVATHIAMPKDKKKGISTEILMQCFLKEKFDIIFEPDLQNAITKSKEDNYEILLIENLRFFEEEKSCCKEFAKQIAQLGDYFVNDAFGTMHRNHASVTLIPKVFGKGKRFLGLLVEHELKMIHKLIEKAPFTAIIGGGKLGCKLPFLEGLLDKLDKLLLCPAIDFTFSKYFNKNVGKSLVEDSLIPLVPKIVDKAKKHGIPLLFPVDYMVAKDHFDGPVSYIDSEIIPDGYVGLSIGPKTSKLFAQAISKERAVFFNGTSGNLKKEQTLKGMEDLFWAMAKSQDFSVIGGGDSVAVAFMTGVAEKIDFLSTGGGATLAYLSGEKLPGLEVFGR
ncbi:phosphoglycerate kinase [Candidatus Dependentiae bacterium]